MYRYVFIIKIYSLEVMISILTRAKEVFVLDDAVFCQQLKYKLMPDFSIQKLCYLKI